MYFLDPERGRRRQALLRDQVTHFTRQKQQSIDIMSKDLTNRAKGLASEAQSMARGEQPDDLTLENRIRTNLGHNCTHPGAIQVQVVNGHVKLVGDILQAESQGVVSTIKSTRGVRTVTNDMNVHESAEGVSSLQGEGHRIAAGTVTPAQSGLVALGGAVLTLYGMDRRGIVGTILGLAGTALVSKAFADVENRHSRPIEARKSNGSNGGSKKRSSDASDVPASAEATGAAAEVM